MTLPGIAAAAYGTGRRTQSPLRIVVELFDMALTRVAHAKAERESGDREKEFAALSAAVRLLCGLDACLDRTDAQAAPVARSLHAYYQRTVAQLHAAMRTRGSDGIERYASVHRQILSMREAWARLAGAPSLRIACRHELPGNGDRGPATEKAIMPPVASKNRSSSGKQQSKSDKIPIS